MPRSESEMVTVARRLVCELDYNVQAASKILNVPIRTLSAAVARWKKTNKAPDGAVIATQPVRKKAKEVTSGPPPQAKTRKRKWKKISVVLSDTGPIVDAEPHYFLDETGQVRRLRPSLEYTRRREITNRILRQRYTAAFREAQDEVKKRSGRSTYAICR